MIPRLHKGCLDEFESPCLVANATAAIGEELIGMSIKKLQEFFSLCLFHRHSHHTYAQIVLWDNFCHGLSFEPYRYSCNRHNPKKFISGEMVNRKRPFFRLGFEVNRTTRFPGNHNAHGNLAV